MGRAHIVSMCTYRLYLAVQRRSGDRPCFLKKLAEVLNLPAGNPLAASAFTIGSTATTASHRIVYNKATGELFYDADGSGMAAGQTKFAVIGAGHSLSSNHFLLV